MTGPMSTLLSDDERAARIAASIERDEAAGALAGHRARRWPRLRSLFRGHAEIPPAPPAPAPEAPGPAFDTPPGGWPSWIAPLEPPEPPVYYPAPGVTREYAGIEDTAWIPAVQIADDLHTDTHPSPRPYAPPPARWGEWDTPANREPMRPVPPVVFPPVPVPADESARRMAVLVYPPAGDATRDHYAAVLRQAGAYTETRTEFEQASAWYWLPAMRGGEWALALTWAWQRDPLLAIAAKESAR